MISHNKVVLWQDPLTVKKPSRVVVVKSLPLVRIPIFSTNRHITSSCNMLILLLSGLCFGQAFVEKGARERSCFVKSNIFKKSAFKNRSNPQEHKTPQAMMVLRSRHKCATACITSFVL